MQFYGVAWWQHLWWYCQEINWVRHKTVNSVYVAHVALIELVLSYDRIISNSRLTSIRCAFLSKYRLRKQNHLYSFRATMSEQSPFGFTAPRLSHWVNDSNSRLLLFPAWIRLQAKCVLTRLILLLNQLCKYKSSCPSTSHLDESSQTTTWHHLHLSCMMPSVGGLKKQRAVLIKRRPERGLI